MRQQLRLAERRDVFKRPISAPAEFGLMILQMLDDRKASDQEVFAVKAALAGHSPKKLPELFPQWFPPDTLEQDSAEADEALATGAAVEDYSGVKWMSPKDTDMEEMMRLSEALLATSHVSVSGDSDGEWV